MKPELLVPEDDNQGIAEGGDQGQGISKGVTKGVSKPDIDDEMLDALDVEEAEDSDQGLTENLGLDESESESDGDEEASGKSIQSRSSCTSCKYNCKV